MSNVPLPERKMAPVQGWPQGIPWSLHLEAYAAYCKKWSPQPALIDLEGRNCRGGFSTGELDEFTPGWRERTSEIAQLRNELAHAAAVSPAKDAEIAGLKHRIALHDPCNGRMAGELPRYTPECVVLRAEVAGLQIKADLFDLAVRKGLVSVHSELIDPRNHGTRCSWLEGHAKACDISNNAALAALEQKP